MLSGSMKSFDPAVPGLDLICYKSIFSTAPSKYLCPNTLLIKSIVEAAELSLKSFILLLGAFTPDFTVAGLFERKFGGSRN